MVVMAVVAGEGAQPTFSGGMTTPAAHLLLDPTPHVVDRGGT